MAMITMMTKVNVKGITGKSISEFLLNCTDKEYQRWWKGVHLSFNTIKRYPDNIGNLVYFDELVGKHRLKFKGQITEIIPGKKLVWQMKKFVNLPGWLTLVFEDSNNGVEITHTITIGFNGAGRILDPLLKAYFSDDFEKEMNEHAQIEFHKLANILS
ncbi:MAG: hypothetical protein QG578_154 [Thermodesulfobacteriota bacterium]|nr:hypothetical protein [Thermodesulfobacteriota bacterium]